MKEYSNVKLMFKLVLLIKPLIPVMIIAIIFGSLGYFAASFISIFASFSVIDILNNNSNTLSTFILIIGVIAILRGILHYIEQYCNHFIAFKLLAIIRDKVFKALRLLAPAKLDTEEKGNLVSIITADIELLEVFYAHTISPIFIAILTSITMVLFVTYLNIYLGIILLVSHIVVGFIIPVIMSKKTKELGRIHRSMVGSINSYFLDSLRGIKETIQYNQVNERKTGIVSLGKSSEKTNKEIKKHAYLTSSFTILSILTFSTLMLFVSSYLYIQNIVSFDTVIISTVTIMSSFGAVTSTANLGVGLTETLASGRRVLEILEEKPLVSEVTTGEDVEFQSVVCENIDFSYNENKILENYSLDIKKSNIVGITGKSGSGKSTILKLLMRFYDVDSGFVKITNKNIKNINTKSLRGFESLVTQDTYLFNDTIENNVKIANLSASKEEVIDACKRASLHDFIMTLPNTYETIIGELGSSLSSGEKQRLSVARAFLRNSELLLLDEPTSNLDSLNEGVILKSLKQSNKTIILVSHRKSTMRNTDLVIDLETKRKS